MISPRKPEESNPTLDGRIAFEASLVFPTSSASSGPPAGARGKTLCRRYQRADRHCLPEALAHEVQGDDQIKAGLVMTQALQ
jgi:hypothetical protein